MKKLQIILEELYANAVLGEFNKEEEIAQSISAIEGLVPEEKNCEEKSTLDCVRCESCNVNSWNACIAEIKRRFDASKI